MAKLMVMMSLSVDGYMEGPDGDLSWHLVDDEVHGYFNRLLASMSCFIHGRATYELMAGYWPTADADPQSPAVQREFAQIWRDMPKLVYSRTLDRVDWNAELRREVDIAEIEQLKARSERDITLGGADLAATFMRHDLIDEYHLCVHPVLVGAGRRLFPEGDVLPGGGPAGLRLAETRTFGNGVVLLRHERADADRTHR